MDGLKFTSLSLLANVAGFLFPIRNDVFGLVLLFMLNFIFGLCADLCNNRTWKFKKAFCMLRDAAVYFTLVASIYILGHIKGEEVAAIHCVSFLIYSALYFYGTNIIRNARLITNERGTLFRVLDFLYYILTLKFIEKSTLLNGYYNEYKSDKKGGV